MEAWSWWVAAWSWLIVVASAAAALSLFCYYVLVDGTIRFAISKGGDGWVDGH